MNEVDVCYLNTQGYCISRKTMRYEIFNEAVSIFNKTVAKFRRENKIALISIRTKANNLWTLEKCERT